MPKYLTEIFKIVTRKKLLNGLPVYWTIRDLTASGEHIFLFTNTQRAMKFIQPPNQSVSKVVFLRIKQS